MNSQNIYQKINLMRGELHRQIAKGDIRKTGKNPYHKNSFFSLDDISGPIQKLMNEQNIYHEININDRAILSLMNLDNMDEIVEVSFPIPQTAHTMQEMGSIISYCRRYLYYLLFNIAEIDDDMEKTMAESSKNSKNISKKMKKNEKTGKNRAVSNTINEKNYSANLKNMADTVCEPPETLVNLRRKIRHRNVPVAVMEMKLSKAYGENMISKEEYELCNNYLEEYGVEGI